MTRGLWAVLLLACASSRPTVTSVRARDGAPGVSLPLDASRPSAPCDAGPSARVCFSLGLSGLGRAADEARFEERPAHAARLADFELDRREVSAALWAECVAAGQCPTPGCSSLSPEAPVRCVSWPEARMYCAFRGLRLPTEAEWERAAAGELPAHRVFPWGDAADPALAARDLTPEGVAAMGAGVSEWVSDPGGFYPALPREPRDAGLDGGADASADAATDRYEELSERTDSGLIVLDDPRGEPRSVWRVVRGGDDRTPVEQRTTTLRRFRRPDDRLPWVGLRCASQHRP